MIRYVVLVLGLAFYAYSITVLLKEIKDQNFAKSFLRLVDTDDNGIVTKKQMKAFGPCEEYDGKKINKIFGDYGRKADVNDLAQDLNEKIILNSVKACIGDVAAFTDPEHLKHLKRAKVEEEMLDTYDFNHDGVINWGQFNIANLTLKKELPYARQVFRFFDKNHDWKISTKELQKVKVAQLATYIGSGGKRRK